MLFKVQDDWKRSLNAQDEARLNDILKSVAKYRAAYRTAHDVKIAQLWSAVLEVEKEKQDLIKRVNRIEAVFKAIADKMNEEETTKEQLKDSLEKY